jgi:hypothetical protein
MLFDNVEGIKGFVDDYFNQNVKKYMRRNYIYLPKDCSEQMSNLMLEKCINTHPKAEKVKLKTGVYLIKLDPSLTLEEYKKK